MRKRAMKSHILHKSICPDGMKPQLKCLFLQLAFFLLAMLVSSCNDRKEYQLSFEKAKSMIDHAPDSSLSIIDGLLRHRDELSTKLQMQCRLYRLSAENKLDTVFRSADEAEHLVAYFNRKGTPNEQMLAYYLLARAYADMGEAPAALEHFKLATEKADTTSKDCDYRQLSRVYSQMSLLFDDQRMVKEELGSIDAGVKYAYKAKDTLAAISLLSYKSCAYNWINQQDSVLYYIDYCHNLLKKHGYNNYAAGILVSSIPILAERGEIAKAQHYMNLYETESGFFDENGNIEKGREVYYYYKGLFYLAIHQPDSAIIMFKKEANFTDFINQEGATRGLSLAYQQKHLSDSAAKYAIKSYEMNDSVTNQLTIEAVAQAQAMYDYNRNLLQAQKEKGKAETATRKLHRVYWLLLITIALGVYYYRKVKKDQKQKYKEYQNNQRNLKKLEAEVYELRKSGIIHEKLIKEKENEITCLKAEINSYSPANDRQLIQIESKLCEDSRYLILEDVKKKGISLSSQQWESLYALVAEVLPEFQQFLLAHKHCLSETEYKTCLLIRLHVKPNIIGSVLGLSASTISKARTTMLRNIFGKEDKPSEFDKRILVMY